MWKLLTVLLATFIELQSAAIDNITKCKLSDGACWTKLYNNILLEVSDNGLPDAGIARLDPYVVKDIEIKILGLINFTLTNGQTSGAKSCRFDTMIYNTEEKTVTSDISCEKLTVEGDYVITKTSALTALLGNIDIHGNGKTVCVIDKLKATLEFTYEMEKGDDGELHYKLLTDSTTYTYKVDKVTIDVDNVYVGTQEISKLVTNIVNENWKAAVKLVGNNFFDRVLEVFQGLVVKFFKSVPANKITIDE